MSFGAGSPSSPMQRSSNSIARRWLLFSLARLISFSVSSRSSETIAVGDVVAVLVLTHRDGFQLEPGQHAFHAVVDHGDGGGPDIPVNGNLDHHVNVAQVGVGAARASAFVLAGVTDKGDVNIDLVLDPL